MSCRPYAKKIQKIIDDHISSLHISELIDPMEITYENFLAFVKKKVKSERAQTALIKNKAIQVIEELMGNNPAYYEKLWERLQKIIEEEEKRRRENAQYFTHPEVYEEVYDKALAEEKERQKIFGDYEATQFEFALYGELDQIKNNKEESIELTKRIFFQIKPETEIVGFKNNISVDKRIMTISYETLNEAGFEEKHIEEISDKILILVKNKL